MKKSFLQLFLFVVFVPLLLQSQVFIDPKLNIEAKALNYKMDAAPTIDGLGTEWEAIPWQELNFNDKDFNGDNLADPLPERIDHASKFKAAWVDGSSVIYLLINIEYDQFLTADSINWYNSDGLELRIDPFDEEVAGEPGENPSSAFNMGFRVGQNEAAGVEGTAPSAYEAKWVVDEDSFPKVAQLEIAITLDASLLMTDGYNMGFHLYCSDIDANQDDSPTSKDAAAVIWPQLFNGLDGSRVGVDAVWEHVYLWGNLECIAPTTITAAPNSIQGAIDDASDGDIIIIPAGEYTENITIHTSNLVIVGEGEVTIKPDTPGLPVITIGDEFGIATGTVIKNLTLNGINEDSSYASTGMLISSAVAKILGNTFLGFSSPITKGDVDSTEAYAAVFEDNEFYVGSGGLNFNTSGTVIRYNYSEEQQGGYAINVKGTQPETAIDIAYNSVFSHRGECGIGYGGSAVFTIHHNMLTRAEALWGSGDTSGDDGIENQDGGGSQDYIYNNTIVGWKSDGIQMGNGSTDFYVRNNLIAYCGSKDYDIRTVNSTDIDYGISSENGEETGLATIADPLFTDILEDDYTITDASPAVDNGEIDPFGFKVRYNGSAPDIGAYETGTPTVGVKDNAMNEIPSDYSLSQNYPNPFNPSTVINFSVPESGLVTLKIYNILGQEVAELVNNVKSAGNYEVTFDASDLTSGMYVYTITAGSYIATRKMMLLK